MIGQPRITALVRFFLWLYHGEASLNAYSKLLKED